MTISGITAATPKVAPHGLDAAPIKDAPPLSKAEQKAIEKEEAKFSEFVVLLDDQATREVEKAFDMPVGLERRQHVVKTLIDNTIKTQAPLWKVLDGLQAAGHVSQRRGYTPLWIQNAIIVYGDETALTTMSHAAGVSQAVKSARHTLDDPGRFHDKLAPIEAAVTGAGALEVPVDIEPSAGGTRASKKPDLSTDPQWNLSRIDIESAHKDGLTGKGVTIGTLDTGVDVSHPALLSKYRGYDPETGSIDHAGNWYDATPAKSEVPVDENGHGTHVTGTSSASTTRCRPVAHRTPSSSRRAASAPRAAATACSSPPSRTCRPLASTAHARSSSAPTSSTTRGAPTTAPARRTCTRCATWTRWA